MREFQRNTARAWAEQLFCGRRCGADRSTLIRIYGNNRDGDFKERFHPIADQIRDSLEKLGVGMTAPLGFNNTYALVMRRSEAQRLGIRTISDLQRYPELKFGLTHEFLERQDGWRPLRQRYGLPQQNIIGIDHALGYSALANGSIAVKDAYSTDAKIEQNDLFVLEDDLHFFPKYEAVFLFRSSTRATQSQHCGASKARWMRRE
jgi:Periplasmic glycine betaine/choline-binding (lipo)protein of an ABC-type transport system (osmoprotectant binding protein)